MSTPIEEEHEPLLNNTTTNPPSNDHRHVFFGQPHHYEDTIEVCCIICQNATTRLLCYTKGHVTLSSMIQQHNADSRYLLLLWMMRIE